MLSRWSPAALALAPTPMRPLSLLPPCFFFCSSSSSSASSSSSETPVAQRLLPTSLRPLQQLPDISVNISPRVHARYFRHSSLPRSSTVVRPPPLVCTPQFQHRVSRRMPYHHLQVALLLHHGRSLPLAHSSVPHPRRGPGTHGMGNYRAGLKSCGSQREWYRVHPPGLRIGIPAGSEDDAAWLGGGVLNEDEPAKSVVVQMLLLLNICLQCTPVCTPPCCC